MPITDRGMDVIALGLNDQQHGEEAKLYSADPHMLAAYCFDLTRKLHYMYMAMRLETGRWSPTFGKYGVNDLLSLAQKINEDTTAVETAARGAETPESDWEMRARKLEEIIRAQWRAIQDDYTRLYREVLQTEPPEHTPRPSARRKGK